MDNLEQQTPMTPDQKPKSSWGPAIGLIIILVLIIAGSFYFFKESDRFSYPGSEDPSINDIESDLLELQTQGQSDELQDIEEDLEDTDLSDLDAELELIEQELSELEENI